jgi:hypothetical protein
LRGRRHVGWNYRRMQNNQIFTPSQLEYIDFDEPATLINAVREVYDQARSAAAKNRNETNACAHDGTARRYDAANS